MQTQTNVDFYKGVQGTIEGPHCHPNGVPGYGNPEYGVMFIGISPAEKEMKYGRPLVGPTGQLLNMLLDGANFPRQQTYCTNIICWWKDDPSPEEADKCLSRLNEEIELLKPKLIIPLGSIVTERFYPTRKFSAVRGSAIWNSQYNAYIMPTNHPAAVYHTMSNWNNNTASGIAADIYRDLCKIPNILGWPTNDSLQHVNFEVVETKQRAQEILYSLPKDRSVAIDVETDNRDIDFIDVFVDRLLCLAISDGISTYWFPRDILDNLIWPSGIMWTMHNALFDAQVIHRHLGVWLKVAEDTMLQSYTVEERGGYHGLKPLAREYNGVGFWEDDKTKKGRVAELEPEKLRRYNAMDSFQTALLSPKLRSMQDADDVRGVYDRLIIPAINVFKEIQYRGINVDQNALNYFAIKWGQKHLELEENLTNYAYNLGWEREASGPFNIGSTDQLGRFLFDILGLKVPPNGWTKGGKRSTREEVLNLLIDEHPFVRQMMEFRHVQHMYGTYVLGIMDHIKYDGLIHPVVKMHGSVTGRPAYANPAVQQIPPPYEVENRNYVLPFHWLRRMFIPHDTEERVVVEADFGKAEIWMAYYRSGDENLYRKLTSGDFHTETGVEVLGKPRDKITGEDRRDMKIVTFGILYGEEGKGLAPRIHRSVPEANDFINLFNENNWQYYDYTKRVTEKLIKTNELVTATGRKRRIIVIGGRLDTRTRNQALNYEIQSTSSDCLVDCAIELHYKLKELDAYIMLTVHDSIDIDCPKRNLQAVLECVHSVMTKARFPEAGIGPIPIEIKVGPNWGKGKVVHNCEKDEYGGCLYNAYKSTPIWKI